MDVAASHNKKNSQSPKRKLIHLASIAKYNDALPPFEKSKVIVKQFGVVKAFSVNTHQGVVRGYNEDRVSVLLNAQQK